jgi:hypothetical protein
MNLIDFIEQNPIVALILFLLIMAIVGFVFRTALRVLLIVCVIGGVLILWFGYSPDQVWTLGKEKAQEAADGYERTVKPILDKEINDAEFVQNEDGTYEIKTASVRITGKNGENKVTVHIGKLSIPIDIDQLGENIANKIEQMRQGA